MTKQSKALQATPGSEVDKITASCQCVPAVDIYETEDSLVVKTDMPGVAEPNLQVEIEQGVLTLAGTSQSGHTGEKAYYRQFRISETFDPDGADAELNNGVLTLRLPKSQAAKPKRVAVKTLH